MGIRELRHRGWTLVRITSDLLEVDVVPGKGGDLVAVRWRPTGDDVLWHTPWGLRDRGAVSGGGAGEELLMEAYPGGWQTVLPNGGDPVRAHGVTWGMHGEAWVAAYDWASAGTDTLVMRTRLVRSPLALEKTVRVDGGRVTVTETVGHQGAAPLEVMWGQHPAFGPPLVGPEAVVGTTARTVLVDDARDTPSADLVLGAAGAWPHVPARGGGLADLTRVPPATAAVDRMAYLTDFDPTPSAWVANDRAGLRADLAWTADPYAYAWYWLEAGGGQGFPWYGRAYVLAIEPHSSYPARGLDAARGTGSLLTLEPGSSRTGEVSLTLSPL